VYNGAEKAVGAIRFDVAPPARFSLTEMLREAGVDDADGAVTYLSARFLRVQPSEADRRAIVVYLREASGGLREASGGGLIDEKDDLTEHRLREVLHLLLSLPEYQLS
jgi:hypothetical protein